MILVDGLMVSGLRWVVEAVAQAVQAELDDDTPLREALLAATLRRDAGEISEEEFTRAEDELLARIAQVRGRAAGPVAFPAAAARGQDLQVQADVAGDFHASASRGRTRRKPAGRRRPA